MFTSLQMPHHLSLAASAKNYARSRIKKSSTSLSTSDDDFEAIHDMVVNMRDSTFSAEVALKHLFRVPDMRFDEIYQIKYVVAQVKKFSVGNCGEYATLALNYLRKTDVQHAEMFSIENGDHAFVVIGRRIASDFRKPETWGDEAVICDPWADAVYPVHEISYRLCCYRREADQNIVYPFDPKIHKLNRLISIGLQDIKIQQRALNEASQKLILIRNQLFSLKDNASNCKEISALLESIDVDIHKIQMYRSDRRVHAFSDMSLERQLSKIVLKHIKHSLLLTEIDGNRKKFTEELVEKWIINWKDVYQWSGPYPIRQYYDIVCNNDDRTALFFIEQLSQQDLNQLLQQEIIPGNGSILHRLLITKQSSKFIDLMQRVSSDAVDVADQINAFTWMNVPVKMLHCATIKKLTNVFNNLVNKQSQAALDLIVNISVNGNTLPKIVLDYLDIHSFIHLLDKLSPKEAIKAVQNIQLKDIEQYLSSKTVDVPIILMTQGSCNVLYLSSLAQRADKPRKVALHKLMRTIKLMQNNHTRQCCIDRLIFLASSVDDRSLLLLLTQNAKQRQSNGSSKMKRSQEERLSTQFRRFCFFNVGLNERNEANVYYTPSQPEMSRLNVIL